MKLSIESYVYHERLGDREAFRKIRAAGFDCVDYSLYWLHDLDEILGENYRENARLTRGLLEEAGLVCNQAHAPWGVNPEDPFDERCPAWTRIARAIEFAALLGAKIIVVHAISEEADDVNERFYKSFAPVAHRCGIRIGVENLFHHKDGHRIPRLGKPEVLRAMMEKLGYEDFGVCIDVGHAKITDNEPQDFLAAFSADELCSLHIHDNDGWDDRHWMPFCGVLDWEAIMGTLRRIGYRGELTLETFAMVENMPAEVLPSFLVFAYAAAKHLQKL